MGLAIRRRRGQKIKIGDNIVVTIGETRGSYTTVLIDAPRDVPVARIEGEVIDGNGASANQRTGRRRKKVLHRLPSAKGRGGAVAGADAGASRGGDSPAVDTAGSRGCGAASDRESD